MPMALGEHSSLDRFNFSFRRFSTLILLTFLGIAPAIGAAPAVSTSRIAASALHQIQALESIKLAKTPTQNKIDSRLFNGLLHQRSDTRLTAMTTFRFVTPEVDGRVPVDIILADVSGIKPAIVLLESFGDIVRAKSYRYRRISARVRLQDLEAIAAMPAVRKVRQAIPARKNAITVSEGDKAHGALGARAFYGVTGAGVKVGVISDGVDSLASLQASGDLPATVQVLPGQGGSGDEGTAMLEIVHDLAPGASLAFATADPDEATFAQNILDLAAAGCNVIVDDVMYLDESPFQDGPVAQAVNTVTAAGVNYFSSAGNEGNLDDGTSGTWEGDFLANGTPALLAGAGPVHNFGDSGQSVLVASANGNPVMLIWAENYDLNTGNASTDFDVYDLDGGLTTIFDASTDSQDGVGGDDYPLEYIGAGTFTGERLVVAKFAAGTTSSTPMFNLIVFGGELDPVVATSGATRGHSAAAAAFSVAATPAAKAFAGLSTDGPFPGLFTSANDTESFSSDGPRRILLNPTGVEITPGNRTSTGGVTRQKPDITAADGVTTSTPGFSTFYGTSAAAPHAAAIAALLKSAVPTLTPAQVRTALISTAIDIEAAGTDSDTGAGIVMARPALAAVGATPAAALTNGTAVPTQVIGDGDAYVEPNEVWSLIVPLSNIGGVSATTISGVLSTSTPGVTISTTTSTYADLAPTASGNNTMPYVFTVTGAVPCGTVLQFTLTATLTGGPSPIPLSFTIRTGAPGTPVTMSYAGPPVPIADAADLSGTAPGPVAIAVLPVAGLAGPVYDINFRFDGSACSNAPGSATVGLDHTFVNDLQLTLRSPDGTPVAIIANTDGSGNNFCQTVLDDESGGTSIQSVVSANAPFSGNFTPNAPLAAFQALAANGNWQLEAQDFFSSDIGNIRAFSLVITPAICDAPPLTANVNATKTVSGTFHPGGTVTYTVTLTNSGGLAQADNPGHEFIDVLPASLTLVTATASYGAAVATIGSGTVTWDGGVAPLNGTMTLTIIATVNAVAPATTVTNQGTISYDADGNGTNESSRLTDNPAVAGASDPTSFVVVASLVTGTKTVSGAFTVGSTVTYTIVLTNSGNGSAVDNPGNELTDVLPAGLTLVAANATSGTPVANIGTNTVAWNGTLAPAATVTITVTATINAGTSGTTLSNQGTIAYDGDLNGTNEASSLTDDPAVAGAANATAFAVTGNPIDSITKTVSGTFALGSTVTYTLVINNTGNGPSANNAGNELTDVLPSSQLTLVGASATSGTAVATIGTNTVIWNGSIPAGASVTITITATLNPALQIPTVSNQATLLYDADSNGTNETTVLSDNPATPAPNDPTSFAVPLKIPALSDLGLALLALAIALVAFKMLKA
jgi:uncharacterized repeat protein (TIGR01451 family)